MTIDNMIDIDEIEANIQNKKANYYDDLFFQSLGEFPIRREAVRYLLKNNVEKSSRILDVGCGTGELLLFLRKKGFTHLYGNDISSEMLKVAQTKLNDAKYYLGNINKIVFEEKYDYIIITEVLHHIPNLATTFNSLKSILSEQGQIIIIEPNMEWQFEDYKKGDNVAIMLYLPLIVLHKYAIIKNRKRIRDNIRNDSSDTFNPFHRHLTRSEIKETSRMKTIYGKTFYFYMGFFGNVLFKGKIIDRIIYEFIKAIDKIIPYGKKGKYIFLVLGK